MNRLVPSQRGTAASCLRRQWTPSISSASSSASSLLLLSPNEQKHHKNTNNYQLQQRCGISFLNGQVIRSAGVEDASLQKDLNTAITIVRDHDPAGFLPGALLPHYGRLGYFAVRAFWVETGLRLSKLPSTGAPLTNYEVNKARFASKNNKKSMTPEERVQWWRQGINALYDEKNNNDDGCEASAAQLESHPVLRLLRHVLKSHALSQEHFHSVLDGRERDVNIKQYLTLDDFVQHSQQSCGSLLNLTLECLDVHDYADPTRHHPAHTAARHIGTCHGLTNALRMAIPMVSNTGKIIIPQELCDVYGIRSPRYLMSALGQGDARCVEALRNAVRDIAKKARNCLVTARSLRHDIRMLRSEEDEAIAALLGPGMKDAMGVFGSRNAAQKNEDALAVLLPGLAAETFLNRLERHEFDLTSKNLRQVGPLEHALCASRTILAKRNWEY